MFNKKFLLGMLLIVFGISSITCAQSGGAFILTDIPSRYNGKYVLLFAETHNDGLVGFVEFNIPTDTGTLARISNGKVNIPMWYVTYNENSGGFKEIVRYNGNHNVEVELLIFESSKLDFKSNVRSIANINFKNVSFSNGSVTKSFQDNDSYNE